VRCVLAALTVASLSFFRRAVAARFADARMANAIALVLIPLQIDID
jgi:hypothetical protein